MKRNYSLIQKNTSIAIIIQPDYNWRRHETRLIKTLNFSNHFSIDDRDIIALYFGKKFHRIGRAHLIIAQIILVQK